MAQLEIKIFIFPGGGKKKKEKKKKQPHKAAIEMAKGKYALPAISWMAFLFKKENV